MTDKCFCVVHLLEGTKTYNDVTPKGVANIVGAFLASKDAHMMILTKQEYECKVVRKESKEDSQK